MYIIMKKIDEDIISKAVQESFKLHKWYIVPETIPLALFYEGLDRYEKDNLAKNILSYPQEKSNTRTGNENGNPRFQRKFPENFDDTAYSPDIQIFFKILKIPVDFLNTPSDTWNNNQTYLKGLQNSKHIKICNDLANWAIKLTQDYCHSSKNKDRLQDIVKVIEKYRAEVPATPGPRPF